MFHEIFKDINPTDLSYDELLTLINESLCGDSNFYSKNISMYGCNADDIYVNNNLLDKKWVDKFKDIRSIPTFFKQIEYYKPDIIYFQNISFLTNDIYNYLNKYNIKIVGQIASPLPANFNHKNYDILISSFPHFVEYFRTLGVTSYYCKLAYEMEVSKLNKINRDITCSFIGSITKDHLERIELLEQLSIYVPEIKIWGKGYDQLPKDSPILKRYQGEVWGKEMFEILSRSQITVNIHINESKNYANNMRLYESTGQGAMLITDYKDNLNDIFNVGEEVVAYRSVSECIKLVKYFILNRTERNKIAQAGNNKTLSNHTYNLRMRELRSILFSNLNCNNKCI